jgi:hypothetical protein
MMPASFDLFRKDARGAPVWLDSTADFETAWLRLTQLASVLPGEYFAFDQTTHRIVVSIVGLGSELIQ